MTRVGSGLLAQTWDGWFFAREAGGKVVFAPVRDPETEEVFQLQGLPGGAVLIGAARGLFVAREADGKVTLVRIGETGPAIILRDLPGGGVLIGAAAGWFVARDAGTKVTVTPAGQATIGNVVLNARNGGYQMRDFGGGVLIGVEQGVRVAGPAAGRCAAQ
jgi:hypothetical protein